MTLHEIRVAAVKKSGRYDLATTTTTEFDTDAGMDEYIKRGQRALDLEQETENTERFLSINQTINGYLLEVPNLRQVTRVAYTGTDGSEVTVDKMEFTELAATYPKLAAETANVAVNWSYYPQMVTGTGKVNRQLITLPPVSAATVFKVYGKYYTPALTTNTSENYWSVNWSEVLILATLRELETDYRNSEGVADYSRQIDAKLMGIDRDLAGDAADVEDLEMEG